MNYNATNMTNKLPQASTITATEMQRESGQIIKRCYVGREHFIVKRDDFPVIAIIPVDEYHRLMEKTQED